MEVEPRTLTANHRSSNLQRILSPLVPVLLIAISYVDPGKWAAAVEGGARYGSDLVFLAFLFNCVAILCQYLAARIAVATGRDLAQICSEEYDKITCVFLGIEAELSMIMLDLTMVLGTAHGLNDVFGIDLFTSVLLTIVAAFLFPLLATLLENGKAKCLCICLASAIMFLYFFGVLMSQQEASFSMGGVLTNLGGESVFVLMALLGSSIMPHNFYLHSSIVQQDQVLSDLPKEAICHDHLIASVCIFSGIFLVNYVLMNLAANVFFSAGLVLLTFQDALSLLDQVFRSSLVPFALVLILFLSNQIMALTWNLSRRMVIHDFFGMDIPSWLHYATIRIIAIVPALCCVWSGGAEGIYQLLIFAQVLVALLLPSSVIPLFRVASSLSIMGSYKVSRAVEFIALVTFICMIGLKVTFVMEMVFGKSDWASNLRWSVGSNVPIPYVILLLVASVSFCFMLWLAATPLKSASSRLDAHAWGLQSPMGLQSPLPESFLDRYQNNIIEPKFPVERPIETQEPSLRTDKSLDNRLDMSMPSHDLKLPESLLDSGKVFRLSTVDENKSETTFSGSSVDQPEVTTIEEKVVGTSDCSEASSDLESTDTSTLKSEPKEIVEKSSKIEGDMQNENDEEGHSWEKEEPSKVMSENNQSLTSEGSGSFRSLGGKGDDIGSGTGSLSRLAGLGRAARRQLTAILDEFWGQLFDFHGQPTQEAKAKRLNVLLGVDSKVDPKTSPAPVNLNSRNELAGYFPALGGRLSDSFMQSGSYNSPMQQTGQGLLEASYGVQLGSSPMWSNQIQLLDLYARNSSQNTFDANERRYSSVHIPASPDCYDQPPATVHGHEFASYLTRMARERGSNYLNGKIDLQAPKSISSMISGSGDSFYRPLAQKPQTTLRPPGFHNVPVPRASLMQSERPYYDLSSPKTAESAGSAVNVKKYYSLPDISGRHIPHRDSQVPGNSAQWDKTMGSGHSVSRSTYEQNFSSTGLRAGGAPMGTNELSPSKVCRDAFSLQFGSGSGSGSGSGTGSGTGSGSGSGSLWSRQPFEQFGVAERRVAVTRERGLASQGSNNEETTSLVDLEGKLVQSFRFCILKLLKLEGSDWLFRQNDGADEDLIDRVAARERFHFDFETKQMNRPTANTDHHFSSERKPSSSVKSDESDYAKSSISLNPYCGEGCVYRADLIISFGVWCIHRILELSLMESRPELWGKYTYVLNRLQGIIDLAFSKARPPTVPCFCLDLPPGWQQRSTMVASNLSLPPPAKLGRGKLTTAATLLEMVKDVELAISCRKGRSGTAAGDVAFPKGKENLASVLKRYKRRLSIKPVGSQESVSGQRKLSPMATPYGL